MPKLGNTQNNKHRHAERANQQAGGEDWLDFHFKVMWVIGFLLEGLIIG